MACSRVSLFSLQVLPKVPQYPTILNNPITVQVYHHTSGDITWSKHCDSVRAREAQLCAEVVYEHVRKAYEVLPRDHNLYEVE